MGVTIFTLEGLSNHSFKREGPLNHSLYEFSWVVTPFLSPYPSSHQGVVLKSHQEKVAPFSNPQGVVTVVLEIFLLHFLRLSLCYSRTKPSFPIRLPKKQNKPPKPPELTSKQTLTIPTDNKLRASLGWNANRIAELNRVEDLSLQSLGGVCRALMGAAGSKLEKALGDQFPEGERYFGLENFGNTCYCNSVLQVWVWLCLNFRTQSSDKSVELKTIYYMIYSKSYLNWIYSQKKKTGVIAPKRFVQRLKKQNELFRSYMHQDAHEFLNFLLNELVDILEKEGQAAKSDPEASSPSDKTANGPKNALANGHQKDPLVTWVHKNFQGILTNETRCLRCETVTARDETFFDLSLDIEQNSSITSCLKNFSSTETLNAEDKFFCDKCCSLQEAQKRMKIKKPPHILVIHLKRFKYIEQLGRYKKLSYRVVFPLELKLSNTVEDADSEYSLFAVVVHVGSGPNHGHYVCLVKSHNHWLFFDDENVEMIDESFVQTFFGSAQEYSSNTDHGYILFYESLGTSNKS
ncbi:hypothetical protein FH972_002652 [Carpinus fangiana]|uniref:Ubiquitin carboxyl-terminal hydrolase n=1 Tax=Carpinus fangiana TaxID=176857 RepID=A0A5N6QI50_9ROSI|nr:hypothetical protein FH972_002652 [Carpinus fangiana]